MKPSSKWIDVSIPVNNSMHTWPGDPPTFISMHAGLAKGDVCNVSALQMSSHCGTHMDSPAHFLPNGATMDDLPWEAVVGPARLVEIQDPESIKVEELKGLNLQAGERILFKTQNSQRSWSLPGFDRDFVYISKEGARYLADTGIQTVGIDYLSVGGFFHDGIETHHALLGAKIWVIEGLCFADVTPGSYELICLPIRFQKGDGAPARCIIRAI
ncbi:MAG: cyclase family protein [Verrucomicrobiota bacterium]